MHHHILERQIDIVISEFNIEIKQLTETTESRKGMEGETLFEIQSIIEEKIRNMANIQESENNDRRQLKHHYETLNKR